MISPEQLRRYPFFGGLMAEELASIAMIAEEVSFPDGAIIFRDGDLATKLYVLASGAVDIVYHIERTGGIETSIRRVQSPPVSRSPSQRLSSRTV